MPRILHILDHSLPLHSGYTFRTRAIMKAQIAAGWDIAGITGARQYQNGETVDGRVAVVEGLNFHRTMATPSGPALIREWKEVSALANAVTRLHRDWPFDLLHAHSPSLNGLAAVWAAQRLGLPLLYEIRAFWEDAAVGNGTGKQGSIKYRLTRALENHVIARAQAVAVICDGLRQDLIGRGVPADKITISPNGVDLELFGNPPPRDTALAAQIGLTGKDVIGYVGSFYDYEGLDDLIAAMAHLDNAGKEVHLLMVGGGPMAAQLAAQALASPAAHRIHFIGRVPHDQVEQYYSLIDILVYPRKSMRLTNLVTPLKPLEAMAQGRLVAASDVGGRRELIVDGVTGTLFPADDPHSMAKAIMHLFENRKFWETRRQNARKFVESERNWYDNIHRYDPVYHLLLGRV